MFIFTDDYRNVEAIREARPSWNVYTLCREDERGYYNNAFNKAEWEYKRDNLIKLFAMVEICISSDLHLGCPHACVNNVIRASKRPANYLEFADKERRFKS